MGFAPIESPPTTSKYLSIQSFVLSTAGWPQFQCQVLTPQFDRPLHLVGLGVKNDTNRSPVHTFLFDSTHSIDLTYLAPFGHNAQHGTQSQTDRAIGISRKCFNIGGLTNYPYLIIITLSPAPPEIAISRVTLSNLFAYHISRHARKRQERSPSGGIFLRNDTPLQQEIPHLV